MTPGTPAPGIPRTHPMTDYCFGCGALDGITDYADGACCSDCIASYFDDVPRPTQKENNE
jgi:hypothetical protein